MDTNTNIANDQRNKKPHKSLAVFLCQIILIYIVVLTSIINLSILDCTKPGVCNLWMVLLSSCLGILLPNPSLRLPGRAGPRDDGGGATNNGDDGMLNFAGMGFTTVDGALPTGPENRSYRKKEEEEETEEETEREETEDTVSTLERSRFNFHPEPRSPIRFGGSSLSLASNAHSTYAEAGSLYNHSN